MKLYYELNQRKFNDELFLDYLKWGGFPLRFDYPDEASVQKYLTNLYEGIVNRDIVGKSALTNQEKQYAIDFVAIKNGKKCFIQVSYLMANDETIKKEFGAYSKITDASPKRVMSLDKIDMSHDDIIHVNIVGFLLRRVDLILK